MNNHTELILKGICTDIVGIHIERNFVDKITEAVSQTNFLLVTGNRGTGKSAVVKEYIAKNDKNCNIICLRAEDFDCPNLEAMFHNLGITIPLNLLSIGLSVNPQLIIVIESLERVLDLNSQQTFRDFLDLVCSKSTWKIIATCRDYAADCVQQNFLLLPNKPYKTFEVGEFSKNNVDELCSKNENLLIYTVDNRIKEELLCNPYFARLATSIQTKINNLTDFKQQVWNQIIAKESVRKNGLPIKRRETFISIAVSRVKSRNYMVDCGQYEPEVLTELESDNLIRFNKIRMQIEITHDILEDWALEVFIEQKYESRNDEVLDFYNNIGSERGILRGFRFWFAEKIKDDKNNLSDFLRQSLESDALSLTWKDEILITILVSESTYLILTKIRELLFAADGKLLSRICLLLNSACRKYDDSNFKVKIQNTNDFIKYYPFLIKPYGHAWQEVIDFLLEHKKRFCGKQNWNTAFYAHVIQILYQYAKNPVDANASAVLVKIAKFALDELQSIIGIYQTSNENFSEENTQLENIIEIIVILCGFNKDSIEKFLVFTGWCVPFC